MDTGFYAMKPVFLEKLEKYLPEISLSAKIEKLNDEEIPDVNLFLSINICFPETQSRISAFASDKTLWAGIVVAISDKAPGKMHFDVKDYLNYKKIPSSENFTFDTRRIKYSDGFDSALKFLVAIYNGPLKDVLTGKVKEDIPFDWGDYK